MSSNSSFVKAGTCRILGLFVLVALFVMTFPSNGLSYDPPIGIPEPGFGIDEAHTMYESSTYDFGSGPESYKDAGNGPYTHYVDNSGSCSDSNE